MMDDEGGDEPLRRGTAGRHMFEGEVTSAGAASIGLLVGIELGIHEEPMLEIVYADLDRLRISDRTEMAGNLQATFVRFLDRGPHFFTSYMLVCLEGSDAPVRPIAAWRRIFDNGWLLAILYIVIVAHSAHLFLHLNFHGWESNRLFSIGIGGGIGWMMMFNVWGIIWRIQKRLIAWTRANAENGTPIPEQSKRMARMALLASRTNFYLSFPLLFFMGAASHYPMFGG